MKNCFRNLLKAKDASKVLYNLVGDDSLFDAFYEFDDEPNADVRFVVADHLDKWVKTIKPGEVNTPTKGWSKDWDPKALEIVRKIVNKHKSH